MTSQIRHDGLPSIGIRDETRQQRRRRVRNTVSMIRRAVRAEDNIAAVDVASARAVDPTLVRFPVVRGARPRRLIERLSKTALLWILVLWIVAFWVSFVQSVGKYGTFFDFPTLL